MKFVIRGHEFDLSTTQITEAMIGIQPTGRGKYLVHINTVAYPVKQVLGQVTKLPPVGYTTGDAYRILSKLGFSISEE